MNKKIKFNSFLVINTFGIGDVLFSTPLLRNLRDNFPSARIFYLCNKKTAAILESHPLISRVFVYERDEFVAESRRSFFAGISKYLGFISGIRKEKIDCAIDLSLNAPFGLFALLAGIRHRYGLDYKNRSFFLNRKLKIEGFREKHVAGYYLDVLKLIPLTPRSCAMEVYSDPQSRSRVSGFLRQKGIKEDDLVIGIAPCGGQAFGKDAAVKRWPEENFTALIKRLTDELKARVFIFAGPNEKADVLKILRGLEDREGVFEFTASPLLDIVALVERCALFIGNDTGPLRFADALNKPLVALFGPVDEKVYGVYPPDGRRAMVLKKDLDCRPCYRKFRLIPCSRDLECLKSIRVEEVLAAAQQLLTA